MLNMANMDNLNELVKIVITENLTAPTGHLFPQLRDMTIVVSSTLSSSY